MRVLSSATALLALLSLLCLTTSTLTVRADEVATPACDIAIPSNPINLLDHVEQQLDGRATITLTWTPPTTQQADQIDYYVVEQAGANGFEVVQTVNVNQAIEVAGGVVFRAVLTNEPTNSAINFRIRSHNCAGLSSIYSEDYSNQLCSKTPPMNPTDLSLLTCYSDVSCTEANVTLSFIPPIVRKGIDYYLIEEAQGANPGQKDGDEFIEVLRVPANPESGQALFLTLSHLPLSTIITIRVRSYAMVVGGYGPIGNGTTSNVLTIVTPGPPLNPSDLVVSGETINEATGDVALTFGFSQPKYQNEADHYILEASTTGIGGDFTTVMIVANSYDATYSVDHAGFLSNTQYTFRIRTHGPGGYSSYTVGSNIVHYVTHPLNPTDLLLVPGSFVQSETDRFSVQLTFKTLASETGIDEYVIERQIFAGAWSSISHDVAASGSSSLTLTLTELIPGQKDIFRVRAHSVLGDATGQMSTALNTGSNILTMDIPVLPINPTNLQVQQTQIDGAGVTTLVFTFTPSDESKTDAGKVDKYLLEASTAGAAFALVKSIPASQVDTSSDTNTLPSVSVSDLLSSTSYVYRLRACRADGVCGVHSSVQATNKLSLRAPSAKAAAAGSDDTLASNELAFTTDKFALIVAVNDQSAFQSEETFNINITSLVSSSSRPVGEKFIGYEVQIGSSTFNAPSTFVHLKSSEVDTTEALYTNSALTAGDYIVRIRLVSSKGVSAWCEKFVIHILPSPTNPVDVKAPVTVDKEAKKATASITFSPAKTIQILDYYLIEALTTSATDGKVTATLLAKLPSVLFQTQDYVYSYTGLELETEYTVRVRSHSVFGGAGKTTAGSNTVVFKTPALPVVESSSSSTATPSSTVEPSSTAPPASSTADSSTAPVSSSTVEESSTSVGPLSSTAEISSSSTAEESSSSSSTGPDSSSSSSTAVESSSSSSTSDSVEVGSSSSSTGSTDTTTGGQTEIPSSAVSVSTSTTFLVLALTCIMVIVQ